MKEILTRIEEFEYIRTITFPESVILNVSACCISLGVNYLLFDLVSYKYMKKFRIKFLMFSSRIQ